MSTHSRAAAVLLGFGLCRAVLAQDYRVSSHEMGIQEFDFTITEIRRDPRLSLLSIPGYARRSAAATRWMLCAYTDLAIKRGFEFWAATEAPGQIDAVLVGFPRGEDSDSLAALGPEFTRPQVVASPTGTYASFCGMKATAPLKR